jgi:hypothetical protein
MLTGTYGMYNILLTNNCGTAKTVNDQRVPSLRFWRHDVTKRATFETANRSAVTDLPATRTYRQLW